MLDFENDRAADRLISISGVEEMSAETESQGIEQAREILRRVGASFDDLVLSRCEKLGY
jgi:hypothetical protein